MDIDTYLADAPHPFRGAEAAFPPVGAALDEAVGVRRGLESPAREQGCVAGGPAGQPESGSGGLRRAHQQHLVPATMRACFSAGERALEK